MYFYQLNISVDDQLLIIFQDLCFNRVFCKKLGSKKKDNLIFEEHDPGCCVDITSTKDGKFITINSNSRSSSEEGCILVSIQCIFLDF